MARMTRVSGSIGTAMFVTIALFFLMQYLVRMGIGRLKRDEDINLKKRKLPRKVKPKEPPPPPPMDMAQVRRPRQDMNVGTNFATGLDLGSGPELGAPSEDTDILPLFRIPPQYPRRAEARGIEGWVELEFTISKTGTVKNPMVVDAYPPSIFDRAATKALLKWKYKPKIEDGKPIERPGVRVLISFELEDEDGRQ